MRWRTYRTARVLASAAVFALAAVGAKVFRSTEGRGSLRAAETASSVGKKVAPFSLRDFRGDTRALADLADKKVVVLAFLGVECPLVKLYAGRLEALQAEFASHGVAVWGVNSNSQDALAEIAAFARDHKLSFPILKDAGNRLADELGAARTPEVFVLDAERVVRYHGRIDDQHGVGFTRPAATREDLKLAVGALLAGKAVAAPHAPAVGCHIGRVQAPRADARVTYANQISRLLQKRCVECHRAGEIGPFALTDYNEVAGWADMMEEVVRQGRMPPWHASPKHGKFANDRHLTDEEKQLLYDWVAAGAPRGDDADLPPPRVFASGWQIGREPDRIVPIAAEPVEVPAAGEVKYQYYVVDPGFTEDKWIEAAEIAPGNRAVVHHVLAFARPQSNPRAAGGGARGYLVGYVPGLRVGPYGPGMAKRVPAGSRLVFQVHYTPIGSKQTDQTRLGLWFADPKTVTHEVRTTSAVQPMLRIPPGEGDYRATAITLPPLPEAKLLSMMPHMHLRGKSFRYEARYPDGQVETLLDIPGYDFNWQTAYKLAEPRSIPAGTRVYCEAVFDNSENNLNNPDPRQTVRWGDQTWEEMMIGYFDLAVPVDPSKKPPASDQDEDEFDTRAARVKQLIDRMDKNGDQKLQRDEVPERARGLFDRVNRDGDAAVSFEELFQAAKLIPGL